MTSGEEESDLQSFGKAGGLHAQGPQALSYPTRDLKKVVGRVISEALITSRLRCSNIGFDPLACVWNRFRMAGT